MLEGLVTNPFLREGHAKADLGAKVALLEHDPQLAALGKLLAQRGWVYVRFLSELARLFVRVARAVETLHQEALQSDAPLHPTIFGRKRMLKPISVAYLRQCRGEGHPPTPLFQLGYGPLWPSRWERAERFCTHLRAFWQSLHIAPRPRGAQGTAWLELWIIFEIRHGACPRSATVGAPLDPRQENLGSHEAVQLHGRLPMASLS